MFKDPKNIRPLLAFAIFILFVPTYSLGQIKINEFVSSNVTGLSDEDGDYPDWLELYNSSNDVVSLNQYFLTDNLQDTFKWALPDITLSTDDHLFVFASGKNRINLINEWHTILDKGDELRYLIPTQELDASWKTLEFNDEDWSIGLSGIGYGDDDDETIIDPTISLFVRKKFTIDDMDMISQLILHMDYDDGFVAYINGKEIARSNIGTSGNFVAYNQAADDWDHEAFMYQGIPPEAYEILQWKEILQNGDNVLAIQVHNYSITSSDLSCVPFLSLGLNEVSGKIASEHINLPQSYLHTNFKIKADGESLYLFRQKELIDSVEATQVYSDVSFGRKTDGDMDWAYFETPTPGQANTGTTANVLNTDSVMFSEYGGMHANSLRLTLSLPETSNGEIHFTTDGSIPNKNSLLYTAPLEINSDSVIRARIYENDKLAGPVTTHTYVIGKNHTLPVVSLSTDPDNLWDYQTGIYVMGPNAENDNPHFGANFWQDWEKPMHFEYFDQNGVKQIDQGVGVKIFGAWSRAHPLKSMSLFARKEYGDGSLSYKFFKNRDNNKYEALVLRNSGNDFYTTHFRDALIGDIMEPIDVESQGYQPTVVYLNGAYWGILNMREKINEHFISDHTYIRADSVNILERDGYVVSGNNDKYKELLQFVESNNLSDQDNYEKVKSIIDIENYIDYLLIQTYIDNRDWPGNNIKFWNTTSTKSRYRWILYDTDFGFGLYGNENFKYNSLSDALASNGSGWPNPPWSTLLFRKLKANSDFKHEFVKRAKIHLNTTWQPSRIKAKVDSISQLYSNEMQAHCTRWNLSYNNWSYNISSLKTFAQYRPDYFEDDLMSLFGVDEEIRINIDISDKNHGKVQVNGRALSYYPTSSYEYADVPIVIEAIPEPGYKFVGWEGDLETISSKLDYTPTSEATHKAIFAKADASDRNVVINEVFYKSSESIKPGDWIELFNAGSTSVNLKDWMFSDTQDDSAFIFNDNLLLSPGAYHVICKDKVKFKTTYPMVNNISGEFEFGLSSNGDYLRLYDNEDQLVDAVDYYPSGNWPSEANGQGASIELKHPSSENGLGENWEASWGGGTPGGPNTNYTDVGIFNPSFNFNANLNCYPNPFRNKFEITFSIEQEGYYSIELLNINGSIVQSDKNTFYFAGSNNLTWNVEKNLHSGVYILRLSSKTGSQSIKVCKLP